MRALFEVYVLRTYGVQRSHIHDQVTSAIRKSNELHTRHQKVDPPRTTIWKRRSTRHIKLSEGHSTEGSSQFIHGGWRARCSPTARGRLVGQKISVINWTNEGAQIGRAQRLAGNVKGSITSWSLLSPVLWPISKPRSRAMTMIRCALSSARSKRLTRRVKLCDTSRALCSNEGSGRRSRENSRSGKAGGRQKGGMTHLQLMEGSNSTRKLVALGTLKNPVCASSFLILKGGSSTCRRAV